jgi:hypothetical protein
MYRMAVSVPHADGSSAVVHDLASGVLDVLMRRPAPDLAANGGVMHLQPTRKLTHGQPGFVECLPEHGDGHGLPFTAERIAHRRASHGAGLSTGNANCCDAYETSVAWNPHAKNATRNGA